MSFRMSAIGFARVVVAGLILLVASQAGAFGSDWKEEILVKDAWSRSGDREGPLVQLRDGNVVAVPVRDLILRYARRLERGELGHRLSSKVYLVYGALAFVGNVGGAVDNSEVVELTKTADGARKVRFGFWKKGRVDEVVLTMVDYREPVEKGSRRITTFLWGSDKYYMVVPDREGPKGAKRAYTGQSKKTMGMLVVQFDQEARKLSPGMAGVLGGKDLVLRRLILGSDPKRNLTDAYFEGAPHWGLRSLGGLVE
jgi:hypothetical protein